jgi:cyclic pyranopterin phosphate synthase
LTTNGIYLARKAEQLKQAGLSRVNISLDSLRPDRFKLITQGGDVQKVLNSIDACVAVGLDPIKLNVVLMKGLNDDEIGNFLQLTMNRNLHVRFIEYMPIGHHDRQWKSLYSPLQQVFQVCEEQGWNYQASEAVKGNGPSDMYKLEGASGSFGLIHPVSEHFCKTCNRLRLTADGNIKPCLAWLEEFQVRKVIGDDEAVRRLFLQALSSKPENHEMFKHLSDDETSHNPTSRRMSQIGG